MTLLGEVHQMEQDGEGPRDPLRLVDGQGRDEGGWIVVGLTSAGVPARASQSLDVVVQVGAVGFRDDLAEQRAQSADVVVQRSER
jgi:hypothetical protein